MSENTYSLGRIGLKICGEYNAEETYSELDVVSFEGSSYAALEESTNVPPTDTAKWCLIARGNPVTTITNMYALPETGTQGQIVFVPVS